MFTKSLSVLVALTLLAGSFTNVSAQDAVTEESLATTNTAPHIRDLFAFVSREDTSRLVFAVTFEPLLESADTGRFDDTLLYQFNVDTNGDAIEDRVIQATFRGSNTQELTVTGPATPERTNGQSQLVRSDAISGDVSTGASPVILYRQGYPVRAFAGLRDDPRDATGRNVRTIVVEVPSESVVPQGSTSIDVWFTTFAS